MDLIFWIHVKYSTELLTIDIFLRMDQSDIEVVKRSMTNRR